MLFGLIFTGVLALLSVVGIAAGYGRAWWGDSIQVESEIQSGVTLATVSALVMIFATLAFLVFLFAYMYQITGGYLEG